jgi:hypothetical protein
MAGSDLDKVGREEFVPAKEFQMRWCHAYLAGYRNVPEHKVSIERYKKKVPLSVLNVAIDPTIAL